MLTAMMNRVVSTVLQNSKNAIRLSHTLSSQESFQMQEYFHNLRHTRNLSESFLTYIWIDGTGEHLRAKTMVVPETPKHIKDVGSWGFDGSSTGQAIGKNSDLKLQPAAMYPDPFGSLDKDRLVMCEVMKHNDDRTDTPVPTNHRNSCMATLAKCPNEEPWFGLEQEYTMIDPTTHRPLGWPVQGFPGPQGPYYCGVGASRTFGRPVADIHLSACILAGLKVTGTNYEVMPGQWEYQVGPCTGKEVGDQVWVSRYILWRVGEQLGVEITLDPKPVCGDWNGTGAHMNFSTKAMREDGGLEVIKQAMPLFEARHKEHIEAYDPNNGRDNMRRLTGHHETASIHNFSWGIAHRGASIRVTKAVAEKGKGWLEDRRPAANCDPYRVVDRMMKTVCLKV